jgi:HB1, ASXL, restriction endonuclease HTH domain
MTLVSIDALRNALAPDPDAVAAALSDAEQELRELRDRQAELEQLIGQARAVLGLRVGELSPGGEVVAPVGDMTLHEAMRHVLRTRGPMSSRELADAINEQGLYRQKQGGPVPAAQISARMSRYRDLFEKDTAGRIQLKEQVR